MPRFFFEITDARPDIPCIGVDLPSLAAARCHALTYAGKLLCDQGEDFWDHGDWAMTVMDEDRLTLFRLVIAALDAPSTTRPALLEA